MSLQIAPEVRSPHLRPGVTFRWPRWTPDDGPAFGIYIRMPPGSRFIGSRKISTSSGVRTPSDIGLGPDDLNGFQAEYFLEDVISQGRCWSRISEVSVVLDRQKKLRGQGVDPAARELIYAMSEGNLEVVADWDPPSKIWADLRAPGWDRLA